MQYRSITAILVAVLLTGCATSQHEGPSDGRSDPLEGFNRAMFNINYHVLDPYIVRPVAVVWRDYVPQPARNGISNFSSNLREPASLVNNLLQAEGRQAAIHFTRFFLNTVFGMGGLIDVAGMANPELKKPDPRTFGHLLGHYGVGYGPYVVLPGYGGATITQDGGSYVDYLYAPLDLLTFWMSAGRWALDGIETRAQFLDQDKILTESTDPYILTREAYFQRQDFLINGGKINPTTNPNQQAIEHLLDEIDSADQ